MEDFIDAFDSIKNLLDSVEEHIMMPDQISDSLRELFSNELLLFFMYLSATDGKISLQEKNMMNSIFGNDFSREMYVQLINDCDIYSTEFEKNIPITIRLAADFDNKHLINNNVASVIVNFMESAGKMLINCDETTCIEQDELDNYISNLRGFINYNGVGLAKKVIDNHSHNNSLKEVYLKKKK